MANVIMGGLSKDQSDDNDQGDVASAGVAPGIQSSTTTPIGVDDHAQQNDIEPNEDGDEDDYAMPPAIDWDNTNGPDGETKLNADNIKKLGITIFQLVKDGYESISKGGRHQSIDRWRDIYETKSPLGEGPWPNSSKIQPPDVRTAVESNTAYQHKCLFGGKYWIRVIPDIDTDLPTARKLQDFYQSEMSAPRGNLKYEFARALSTANVDGQMLGITDWTREVRTTRKRVLINMNLINKLNQSGKKIKPPSDPDTFPWITIDGKQYKWGEKYIFEDTEVTQNHFGFRFANSQDTVLFPATSPSIEESVLCGYFYGRTLAEIDLCERDGYYDSDQVAVMKKASPRAMGGYGDNIESGTLGGLMRTDRSEGVARDADQDIERYGKMRLFCGVFQGYDPDGDGYVEPVLLHLECSTQTILAFQPIPFDNGKINMKELRPDPRIGGAFWGYSQVEKQEENNKELGAITRMGIDLATLSACIYATVEPGRRKVSDIRQKPGITFMDTDDDGKITDFKQIAALPNSILANREDVRKMIQGVGNADAILQGGNAAPGQTNQQTNLSVTSSGVRMRMQLICTLDFLTWFANQFFDYNRQFLEDAVTFTVERDGKRVQEQVTLDDLSIPCRVEAYCDELEPDVALRKQFAEKIFTAMAQSPFAQQDVARLWRILADFCEEMGFDEDLGPRIGTQDEAIAQQAKLVAQQQAQANLQAGLKAMQASQGDIAPPNAAPPPGTPPNDALWSGAGGSTPIGAGQGQPQQPEPAQGGPPNPQATGEMLAHVINNLGQRGGQ